jgi:hypothetical protein
MTKNTFTKDVREFYFSNYRNYSEDFSFDDDLIFSREELKDLRQSKMLEYWID